MVICNLFCLLIRLVLNKYLFDQKDTDSYLHLSTVDYTYNMKHWRIANGTISKIKVGVN